MADTTSTPAAEEKKALGRRGFLGRSAAVGIAAAAAPAVLAACSGGNEGDDSVTGGEDYEQGSAELQQELGAEIDGMNYPDGYKGPRAREIEAFGDGETEFTVLGRTIPEMDYPTNYYANYLEEKTGVKVKYIEVPLGDDGQTKVNALISGGDLPHAMMTGMGLFTPSQVAIYGQQGLFQPVDKLIDEHAPRIREMFEIFPDMRTLFTAPDGRMYAVPSMNDCYHCKSYEVRTYINNDWLEGTGSSMPESLEDFEALMETFKGYGDKPGNSVLVTASQDRVMSLMHFFMGSFLPASIDYMRLNGGTIEWIPTDEKYREGLSWIQEQFRNGTFDKNMFSMDIEQLSRMGDNPDGPRFGVVSGGAPSSFITAPDMSDPNSPGRKFKALPPMEGPDGTRTSEWDWYQIGSPNFVITSECPDPVTMIRWADAQFDLASTISMACGEQGVGWDWADEGVTGISGEQAVYSTLPTPDDLKNQTWWEWGPFFKSMDQRHGESVAEDSPSVEPHLYEAGKAYEPYRLDQETKVPTLAYTMDDAAAVGEYTTNLTQHIEQSISNFATGAADVTKDADWDAFVNKFDELGLPQYLEIQQRTYDNRAQ